MSNSLTNQGAPFTTPAFFRGFVANSVGMAAANTQFGGPGSTGVYIPTVSGVAVDDVSNLLGYANAQNLTATSQLLNFNKWKGFHFIITAQEETQSSHDLGVAHSERSGARLAAQVDADLFTEAATSSQVYAVASAGTLGKADIINGMRYLHANNVPAEDRVIVTDPEGWAFMMGIDSFVGADQTGLPNSRILTGQVGSLLGAPVLMSQNLGTAKTLFIYRPALALGISEDINVIAGRVPGQFGTTYEGSVQYGVKLIDSGGVVVINNY